MTALPWMSLMDLQTTQTSHRSCHSPYAFFIALLIWSTTPALAQELFWEPLRPGLTASIWQPDERCPDINRLLVIKVNPALYRFSVHHFAQEGLLHPPTIDEWQKRSSHEIVFNAGLFRENFAYLGLLFKDGKSLGSRRHSIWQGLFVAEPHTPLSLPKAGILDLASDVFHEETPAYLEAAQSLMLLDRKGTIRVRQTGKRAYQTVVAEEKDGHILILKSLGPVSLHGLGQCLRDTFPSITLAMAMDGGSSSDLVVSESLWKNRDPSDARATWKDLFTGRTTAHIPLPAIIGLSPRENSTGSVKSSPQP